MKKTIFNLLIICLLLVFSISYIYAFELTGRIYEKTKKEGIPGLVIKLKYPKILKKSEKITKTEQDGKYIIKDLDKGRYLLEIYDTTEIIYREVIEIDNDKTKEIELEKK